MVKKGYKYNFSNFMGQCELNYMLLCRLLPDMYEDDLYNYRIKESYRINLEVIERYRYTTCVRFSVNSLVGPDWLRETDIDVRLYHDAHLAEVVDTRGVALRPINPYPNPSMLQKDEKQALHTFLGEWLSFCLKHGQSTETIPSASSQEKRSRL